MTVASSDADACARFLDTLRRDHVLLAGKVYRIEPAPTGLPTIPCLDHEARLSGAVPAHLSVYLQDGDGALHEVTFFPGKGEVSIDVGSTLAETPASARAKLRDRLVGLLPGLRVTESGPSVLRGDARVAQVVRSQLRLHEVLAGDDTPELRWRLEALRAIADLMEKESRVSSWAVRTLTPLVLAAIGVGSWWVLGAFHRWLDEAATALLRYLALTGVGLVFLVVGLKAVHLTEMGTRVWKRATEYRLILDARQRARASARE